MNRATSPWKESFLRFPEYYQPMDWPDVMHWLKRSMDPNIDLTEAYVMAVYVRPKVDRRPEA